MKRKIIYIVTLFFPCVLLSVSDLHFIVDSSLGIPMRNLLIAYSKKSSMVLTSDFIDSAKLKDIKNGSVIIMVKSDVNNKEDSKSEVEIASDNLYLCTSEKSPLNDLINKNEKLSTTIKIIKKHSKIVVSSQNSELGNIVKSAIQKLNFKDYIEVDNFEDIVYLTEKNDAFSILPGVIVFGNKNSGIKPILKIPNEMHKKIRYTAVVIEDQNYKKIEDFFNFMILSFDFINGSVINEVA